MARMVQRDLSDWLNGKKRPILPDRHPWVVTRMAGDG